MSTRARIGVQLESGEIKSIYVWRDGAPDVLGEILAEHYESREKATELVAHGNLIDIDTTIVKCNFEQPSANSDTAQRTHKTFAAYQREQEDDILYKYIFRDGVWGYWEVGE